VETPAREGTVCLLSLPPLNLTLISLSMYLAKSRIFSFFGRSVCWCPPPPPRPPPPRPPRWLLSPSPRPLPPLPRPPRKLARSDIAGHADAWEAAVLGLWQERNSSGPVVFYYPDRMTTCGIVSEPLCEAQGGGAGNSQGVKAATINNMVMDHSQFTS
jgi:hypothetical protein